MKYLVVPIVWRTLFFPEGLISGRNYLRYGAGLFLLKYGLDAALVWFGFKVVWLPWDYLNLRGRTVDLSEGRNLAMACVMLVVALPFIWAGVVLTLKRLRSAGWSRGLVWLFFIPYLNLLFFLFLIWAPEEEAQKRKGALSGDREFVVKSFWRTAFFFLPVVLGAIWVVGFSAYLEVYGYGLFVGLPFVIGFLPGLLHRTPERTTFFACFKIVLWIHGAVAVGLLLFAMEGLICWRWRHRSRLRFQLLERRLATGFGRARAGRQRVRLGYSARLSWCCRC